MKPGPWFAVLLAWSCIPVAAAQPRIMALGDSITAGNDELHTTWRCNLWAALQGDGYVVDFVGSKTGAGGAPAVCSLSGNFDADHEGHPGAKVSAVLAHIQDPANQVSPPPDLVLVHMGVTNLFQELIEDILMAMNQVPTNQQVDAVVDAAVTQLGQLIDELRAQNPSVTILVAQIIPAAYPFGGGPVPFTAINLLNARIPQLAAQKDTAASRVFVVDQNTGYSALLDSIDGVHPNASGEVKIAAGWLPMVRFVLDSQNCQPAASATITSSVPVETLSPGDPVTFTATVSGGTGPFLYQWRRDGQDIQGAVQPSHTIEAATIAQQGSYDCVVRSFCCTLTSNSIALAPLEFAPPQHAPAGSEPVDLVAKDLGPFPDGFADLVAADRSGDAIALLQNDGQGGFGAVTLLPLTPGDAPSALAVGEFVPGGALELAVACAGSGLVRILEENAGWSEVLQVPLPAGLGNPAALVAADLSGAGAGDLAIALEGTPTPAGGGLAVSMHGTPAQALIAPPGGFGSILDVVAADLDGDGDLDLAAAQSGSAAQPVTTDSVLLYRNDSGSLSLVATLAAGQNPRAIVAGDLNGDGHEDLVVGAEAAQAPAAQGELVLLEHDGSGLLTPASYGTTLIPGVGGPANDLVCADLRNDSIPGMLQRLDVAGSTDLTGNLSLYLGYDGTAFQEARPCAAGVDPVALVATDLNGDHTPDLAVANRTSGTVTVLLALPRALAQTFGTGCPGTAGVAPAITPFGLPVHGKSFAVRLESARPFAPALLGISLGQAGADLGGCSLWIALPIVFLPAYADATGAASMPLAIPPATAPFVGMSAWLQWFVYDPAGAYAGQMAFSNGLRARFGSP